MTVAQSRHHGPKALLLEYDLTDMFVRIVVIEKR